LNNNSPLPPRAVGKVDYQLAILRKTINEQAGRIDRQKGQLSNQRKQNAKLKKQAVLQSSQGRSLRREQMAVD
jgi:hypothetical protein